MAIREAFDYYEITTPPLLTSGVKPEDTCLNAIQNKSRPQLEAQVRKLTKEVEILNRELKSKQLVIDIKTKEAERMKQALDTLLDSAALVNMVLERE